MKVLFAVAILVSSSMPAYADDRPIRRSAVPSLSDPNSTEDRGADQHLYNTGRSQDHDRQAMMDQCSRMTAHLPHEMQPGEDASMRERCTELMRVQNSPGAGDGLSR